MINLGRSFWRNKMAKNHMARLAAPKAWPIKRRGSMFVAKQNTGRSLELSMPLNMLLKEILGVAKNTREAKKLLNSNEVLIDCRQRRDARFPVGIFDTLQLSNANQYFRVSLSKNGKISLAMIKKEEASVKPAKIIGKKMVRGKLQLNLYDGKNILVSGNSYKVGDTLLISLPEHKIIKHLKLDKKSAIFLVGGKHIGETGTIEDIVQNKIIYKDSHGSLVETSKKYAFVVGDTKPLVTLW